GPARAQVRPPAAATRLRPGGDPARSTCPADVRQSRPCLEALFAGNALPYTDRSVHFVAPVRAAPVQLVRTAHRRFSKHRGTGRPDPGAPERGAGLDELSHSGLRRSMSPRATPPAVGLRSPPLPPP